MDEAIACYEKAIKLDSKLARAHVNLGNALFRKGRKDEAIARYHNAIALDPKYAAPHHNLGRALYGKGQVDEAIACYHKAIALDPKDANAHGALGLAFLGKGRYAEARDASARALALLPANHPLRAYASRQLQECGRLLKLEARLPRLIQGEEQPASARESLDVAQMCVLKKMHAAAARFSATAFAADAKLADDLQAQHRYNAACSAALAAAGQGEDAAKLDAKERTRLRQQALDWLRADLAQYTKLLTSGPPAARPFVQQRLRHWQKDSDLAGIRDQAALAKLSDEERTAFTQLWADVAALEKKALEVPASKVLGPVHEVGQGLELRGQLDRQTPALVYQVKLAAGKSYVIDMVSPDQKALDPYLILSDAAGKKLAEDDDSGGGLNARIRFRAEKDSVYRIQATSFNGGSGAFTLTVRGEQPQPPRGEMK